MIASYPSPALSMSRFLTLGAEDEARDPIGGRASEEGPAQI